MSSISSRANSSFDLTVVASSGLTLQICQVIALSLRRKRCGSGLMNYSIRNTMYERDIRIHIVVMSHGAGKVTYHEFYFEQIS